MAKLLIYGESDDLIEVDGDISEEFNTYSGGADAQHYLAFSDGTLIEVCYRDGNWILSRLVSGSATFTKQNIADQGGGAYSELVTLDGEIAWVAYSHSIVRAPSRLSFRTSRSSG